MKILVSSGQDAWLLFLAEGFTHPIFQAHSPQQFPSLFCIISPSGVSPTPIPLSRDAYRFRQTVLLDQSLHLLMISLICLRL